MVLRYLHYSARWVHLVCVVVFVVTQTLLSLLLTTLYCIPPVSHIADCLWWRLRPLRQLFSYKLTGAKGSSVDPECSMTTIDLIKHNGYPCEEHVVETDDGYILGLARIPHSRGLAMTRHGGKAVQVTAVHSHHGSKNKAKPERREGEQQRPVVLLMHGIMMSSDIWVLQKQESLPFLLADQGYDVWLGNNRGNRYSCKHRELKPSQSKFWDYSLDDLAEFDVRQTIEHILAVTKQEQLAYIGFSNGSAQCFASLSRFQDIRERIKVFVALSPAVRVTRLRSETVASLMASSPEFLYLLFGRKAIVPTALTWQRILSAGAFTRVIDACVHFLFGWEGKKLDPQAKSLLYSHYYSYSSVKLIAGWFQIIRAGRFQMYDDDLTNPHTQPAAYDVSRIRTPIALFVGTRDTLIDYHALVDDLPKDTTTVHELDGYEHVDTVWAQNAPREVYPHVLATLNKY